MSSGSGLWDVFIGLIFYDVSVANPAFSHGV